MAKRDDDRSDRLAILARRQLLIASAVAGMAVSCKEKPEPCLSVAPIESPDAGGEQRPVVCLAVPLEGFDAGEPRVDADAPPAAEPHKPSRPRPCLSVRPPDGGCKPPYTVDKNGVRKVKPGCL